MRRTIMTLLCCVAASIAQADAPQLDVPPRILPSIEQVHAVTDAAHWTMPTPALKKKRKKAKQDTWHLHTLSADGVTVGAKFPQTPMMQEEGSLSLLLAYDPSAASIYALSIYHTAFSLEDYQQLGEAEITALMQVHGTVTHVIQSETNEGLPCWNYLVNLGGGQGALEGRIIYAHGYVANAFVIRQKGGRPEVQRFLDSVNVQ